MRSPGDFFFVIDVSGEFPGSLRFEEFQRVADDLTKVVDEVQFCYGVLLGRDNLVWKDLFSEMDIHFRVCKIFFVNKVLSKIRYKKV